MSVNRMLRLALCFLALQALVATTIAAPTETPVIADAETVEKLESRRPAWSLNGAAESSTSASSSSSWSSESSSRSRSESSRSSSSSSSGGSSSVQAETSQQALPTNCPTCSPPAANISVSAQAELKHDWGDRIVVEADLKPEPPKPTPPPKDPLPLNKLSDQQLLAMLAATRKLRIQRLVQQTAALQEVVSKSYAQLNKAQEAKLALRRQRRRDRLMRKVQALTKAAEKYSVLRKSISQESGSGSVTSLPPTSSQKSKSSVSSKLKSKLPRAVSSDSEDELKMSTLSRLFGQESAGSSDSDESDQSSSSSDSSSSDSSSSSGSRSDSNSSDDDD